MAVFELKKIVKQIFTDYLEHQGQRKTVERFVILDEIYSMSGSFDVEKLYKSLHKSNFTVSRATLYNTIDLLLECNLVKKSPNKGLGRYEKTYSYDKKDQLVCSVCGRIDEFCDPRMGEVQRIVCAAADFEFSHYILQIHGVCAKCRDESISSRYDFTPLFER